MIRGSADEQAEVAVGVIAIASPPVDEVTDVPPSALVTRVKAALPGPVSNTLVRACKDMSKTVCELQQRIGGSFGGCSLTNTSGAHDNSRSDAGGGGGGERSSALHRQIAIIAIIAPAAFGVDGLGHGTPKMQDKRRWRCFGLYTLGRVQAASKSRWTYRSWSRTAGLTC